MNGKILRKAASILLSASLLFSDTVYALTPADYEKNGSGELSLMTGLSGGHGLEAFSIEEPQFNVPRKMLLGSVFGGREYLSDRTGYNDLEKRSSPEARKTLYGQIYDFAVDFTTNDADASVQILGDKSYNVATSVDYASLGLSKEEALETWASFKNDNPEFYWLSDTAVFSEYVVYIIAAAGMAKADARAAMNDIISAKLSEYQETVKNCTTDFEKALAVHDKLAKETGYALDGKGNPSVTDEAHSIMGVFSDGKAVCEGYAKAYSLILSGLGIENIYVSGYAVSKNKNTGKDTKELHSWNLVKLDDSEWHWVDTTWDSTTVAGEPAHYYFSPGNTAFVSSHEPFLPSGTGTQFLYELPEASGKTLTPTALCKGNEVTGVYPTLSKALSEVSFADASVMPLRYSNTATVLENIKSTYPVTVRGNYYDLSSTEGEGKFSTDKLVFGDGIEIECDIVFENISVEALKTDSTVLIKKGKKAGFNGKLCRIATDISADGSELSFNADTVLIDADVKAKKALINTKTLKVSDGNHLNVGSAVLSDEIKAVSQTFFSGFEGIKSISFGNRTNFISSSAFTGLADLEEVSVKDDNGTYYSENGILYRYDDNSLPFMISLYPASKPEEEIRISSPIVTAEDNAFSGNAYLKTVILDHGFLSIGKGTFANVKSIEKVFIPSTVTMIGKDAFKNSPSLVIYCTKDSAAETYAKENSVPYVLTDEWTYIFLDSDNNTVLKSVTAFAGEEIIPPEAPSKADTDHSVFVFRGWEGFEDGMKLDKDIEFTPVFEEVMNKYRYVFRNADGTEFLSGELAYGEKLVIPEEIPVKKMTEKYCYEFSGWKGFEGEEYTITGDVEFEPLFEEKDRLYDVIFTDETGENVISSKKYKYGELIMTPDDQEKAPTDKERYTFTGWTGYEEGMTVTENAEFAAEFSSEPNVYTYRFVYTDLNGEKITIKEDTAYFNTEITAPGLPENMKSAEKTYVAVGYEGFSDGMLLTEDIEFKTVFEPFDAPCRIVFENWDKSVILALVLEAGEEIFPPEEPSKTGDVQFSYEFSGFGGFEDGMKAEGDTVFTAEYTELVNEYMIRFTDGEYIISEEFLPYGSLITPPEYEREDDAQYSYEFLGFEGLDDDMTVTGNAEFNASIRSTVKEYTYTFLMDDGETVIETKKVPYGTVIEAPDARKTGDEQYSFIFVGFEGFEDGYEITEDCIFTAVFDRAINEYEIIFLDEDGKTEISRQLIPYGEEINAPDAEKEPDAQFSYEFTGFEGFEDGMTVSGDCTFIAGYKKTLNEYTITFKNDSGNIISTKKLKYGEVINEPEAPSKKDTAEYSYRFDHFEGYSAGMTVKGDSEFKAVYSATKKTYTYEFYDETGKKSLKKVTAEYGTVITPPQYSKAKDIQYTYTLSEWSGFSNGMKLTGNVSFSAVFAKTLNRYTYSFRTEKGTIIYQATADYGSTIIPPEAPEKKGYRFKGYKGFENGAVLVNNVSFTAEYELCEYDLITDYAPADVCGEKALIGIPSGTSLGDFLGHIENELSVVVSDRDGIPVNDGNALVSTGMTAELHDENGNVLSSRILGVSGDANGDGNVTLTDLVIVQDAYMSGKPMTGYTALALEADDAGAPLLTALIKIRDHVFKAELK